MNFFHEIPDDVRSAQIAFKEQSRTRQLILGALLGSFAAVFQSAGGFLPGIGYLISPFATAPILICSLLSLPLGLLSFFLTNLLLILLQPSELFVFPLTTGLIGLGIGAACSYFKKKLPVLLTGAISLALGILSLLYVFQFPVLGPEVTDGFSFLTCGGILLFCFVYSWIWVELGIYMVRKITKIIVL